MPHELDIEREGELEGYLRAAGLVSESEAIVVRRLSGGVSNRVMLVERDAGVGWVVKQALPKLRVAVDWFSDPARIGREALGLKFLGEMLGEGVVPRPVFLDEGRHVLVMEEVPRPHENWKAVLMRGEVDLGLVGEWGRLLGRMHRVGWERRGETAVVFEERAFFESLRTEAYYEYAGSRVSGAGDFIGDLVNGMRGRRWAVVHGDWSPKNALVVGGARPPNAARTEPRPPDSGRLILLDHEVIHFGDPGFDLGFSMTHLLSKGHHLSERRGVFGEAAKTYWRAYRAELGEVAWGAEIEGLAVQHTLGCLLARVAGRSVLEYLTDAEKERQRGVVVDLMRNVPRSVEGLVESFLGRV